MVELGEKRDFHREMDHYLRQFVKYKTVFKTHASHDGINISGAKNIIKKLRDCVEDDIRDNDLGVEFVPELKHNEFLALMRRCPMKTWDRLANFDSYEVLH